MKSIIIILSLSCFIIFTFALDNGLGLTPPMGWNSWNYYGCNINENITKSTALAMVQSGLAKKGYIYVNLDDCWQIARNNVTGEIIPDPTTFPSGIADLADYIHTLGLKFGLYSDAGKLTCQKRPGSLGYEQEDASTYAQWGVDYLKYDNCHNEGINPRERYPIMRDALNTTNRPIYYSMCEWGQDEPWKWAYDVANSWRITLDIKDYWESIMLILDVEVGLAEYAHPGGWNDPDMLEVGNKRLSYNEQQSHFAFWSILKAPLIIGCDVSNMTPETLKILGNEDVIAVNQDPLGIQGRRVRKSGEIFFVEEIWAGELQNNSLAVIVFNKSGLKRKIKFTFAEVGFAGKAFLRDLINQKDIGSIDKEYEVEVDYHSVAMFKLIPIQNVEIMN